MYHPVKTATLAAAFAFLSIGVPAYSHQAVSQDKPAADPNERVCEDVTQTGSRLATKRFCATRSEWEDKKRQDREAVEKAQMSPCVLTHNGGNGKPGC